MISLKRLIHAGEEELLDAYRRTTVLLMQALALHSVVGEDDEYQSFRLTVTSAADGIHEQTAASDVLIAAGTVSKALQEYGRRTTHFLKAQSLELQSMIGMLTKTMSEISVGSEKSITRLQEIERKLAKTAVIDDLRTLKLRMSECLDSVRDECNRQKNDATSVVEGIRSGIATVAAQKSATLETHDDPVTGLPPRSAAEAELKKASAGGKRIFAGVFLVDRIQAINSRFGFSVGDKIMLFYVQKLTEALSSTDQIFRWCDYGYLAILEREGTLDSTRRELSRHLFQKWDRPFELGARSVVLPISATWLLIDASGRAAQAITDIDSFVAKTIPAM